MNKLVQEILNTEKVPLDNGKYMDLNSSIGLDEAEFIDHMIRSNQLNKAVEIGCALGLSSLVIANALKKTPDSKYYILDPFQSTQWNNIGISNLKKEGFTNYELIEERSEFALPKLVSQNVKLNFGYIDGWHTFDHTLIDFFYINRLLEVGGIVVIDDVHMSAVSKVARYILKYPCYEFAGAVQNKEITTARKVFDAGAQFFSLPRHILGKRISEELFNTKVLEPDSKIGLDCTMIAFRKISEDQREWNWHKNF